MLALHMEESLASAACSDDDDEEEEEEGAETNSRGGESTPAARVDAAARRLATQAVIDLSDKLAAAQQENAALQRRLHDARRLSKVSSHADCIHTFCCTSCTHYSPCK